jgi:hypothetical protein
MRNIMLIGQGIKPTGANSDPSEDNNKSIFDDFDPPIFTDPSAELRDGRSSNPMIISNLPEFHRIILGPSHTECTPPS